MRWQQQCHNLRLINSQQVITVLVRWEDIRCPTVQYQVFPAMVRVPHSSNRIYRTPANSNHSSTEAVRNIGHLSLSSPRKCLLDHHKCPHIHKCHLGRLCPPPNRLAVSHRKHRRLLCLLPCHLIPIWPALVQASRAHDRNNRCRLQS